MKCVLLATALLCSTFGFAQAPQSELPIPPTGITGRITATSVWQMPATFLPAAHKACDKSLNPPSFIQCFIVQMSKAGAPPSAVAFTQSLLQQSGGDFGIMSGFNAVGPVDVAFVTYPLRANTNNGLLFVNGTPKIVNAENLKLLDQAGMQQSPQFQNTKNAVPQGQRLAGRPRWNHLAQLLQESRRQPVVHAGLPAAQRMPRLCSRWLRRVQLELRRPPANSSGTSFLGMTPPPVQ